MPPAARVGDITAHGGTIVGPGRAERPDRRPACGARRRHARLPAGHPAPRARTSAGRSCRPARSPSSSRGRPAAVLGGLCTCVGPPDSIVARRNERPDRRVMARRSSSGQGLAFPLRVDATGSVALVVARARDRGVDRARSSAPRPASGRCGPSSAAASTTTCSRPPTRRRRASSPTRCGSRCVRWEPRIEVSDVVVAPDPDDRGILLVDVRYRSGTRTTRATSCSRSTSSPRSRRASSRASSHPSRSRHDR